MFNRSVPEFVFISITSNMTNNNDNETDDVDIANAKVIDDDTIEQGNATTLATATVLNESSTKRDVSRATASQISDETNEMSNSTNLKKTPTKTNNGNDIISLLYGSPSSNLRSRLSPSTAVIEKRKHKQKTTDKSKKVKVINSSVTDNDDVSDA
jgi:hypothetical protein